MANSNQDQIKKNTALFPDYPRGTPITDATYFLKTRWDLALSSLFQALQKYFKPEGILIPSLSSEEIASIEQQYQKYRDKPLPPSIPDISGQLVFDKNNGARVLKYFLITYNSDSNTVLSASWKTITAT